MQHSVDLASVRRLDLLEIENDALRCELDDLRRLFLGSDLLLPLVWGLTATEQRIMAVLLRRPRATKEQCHAALRGDERDIDIATVESHISKMRRKLRPFSIQILSARYQGYWIEAERRTELLAEIGGRS